MKIRNGKRGQFIGGQNAKQRVGTRDGKAVVRLEGRVKAWTDDGGERNGAYKKPGRG